MSEVIQKSLDGRIWIEVSPEAVPNGAFLYASHEIIARDGDGNSRSVDDHLYLSDHYKPLPSKNETLEALAASLLPRDRLITMDLKSLYHHLNLHKNMPKYFVVSVMLAERRCVTFINIVLPFRWSRSVLVLSFGKPILYLAGPDI